MGPGPIPVSPLVSLVVECFTEKQRDTNKLPNLSKPSHTVTLALIEQRAGCTSIRYMLTVFYGELPKHFPKQQQTTIRSSQESAWLIISRDYQEQSSR